MHTNKFNFYGSLIFIILSFSHLNAKAQIHHLLQVQLNPSEHQLTVKDQLSGFTNSTALFALHKGLTVTTDTKIEKIQSPSSEIFDLYQLQIPSHQTTVTLNYSGSIYHPVENDLTAGIISETGVVISSDSYWFPYISNTYQTFDMSVTLPSGWKAVSQGVRTIQQDDSVHSTSQWQEFHPQDDIYIIAARFFEYNLMQNNVEIVAFLRSPDQALAQKYLNITHQYLSMYSSTIAPYPYKKFAIIENFFETGYGMPSFTLLGPTVIRFPFILYSSYPHEILHNWWGNSVYVDYDRGNWCEGITVYMADHYFQSIRGQGALYRLNALKSFTDYVKSGKDFPLRKFHSRHDDATRAVGYDKSMMFYHMLHKQLGDETFYASLRDFYQANVFKFVSFDEILASFEKVSHDPQQNLPEIFSQWIDRTGAPELTLSNAQLTPENSQFKLSFTLNQIQKEPPYQLFIPIEITFPNTVDSYKTTIKLVNRSETFNLTFNHRPKSLKIDSEFDVFRRLNPLEVPATLSGILGESESVIAILPSQSPLLDSYQKFAQKSLNPAHGKMRLILDRDITSIAQLDANASIWVLGWENIFQPYISIMLKPMGIALSNQEITIDDKVLSHQDNTVILNLRRPNLIDRYIGWLTIPNAEWFDRIGQKFSHYGTSSYIGFKDDTNILKGEWPSLDSPLTQEF